MRLIWHAWRRWRGPSPGRQPRAPTPRPGCARFALPFTLLALHCLHGEVFAGEVFCLTQVSFLLYTVGFARGWLVALHCSVLYTDEVFRGVGDSLARRRRHVGALFTLHCLLYTVCFTLFALHWWLYTLCFTLFALHFLLHTLCFTPFALNSLLCAGEVFALHG